MSGTLIQTALATKTGYDNIGDLYNLNLEIRWSLLDLLRIKKISLIHGLVFSSGMGDAGRLGDGDTSHHSVGTPSSIDITYIGERKVVQVSAGSDHSLFVCEDGTVFSSGMGLHGRLGDGDTSRHEVGTPSPIDYTNIGDRKVIQVSAGHDHSLFLCDDGSVFSSGSSQYGNTPYHEVGTPSPIDITNIGDRKVIQVAAGYRHSLFLCEDGTVFSSGNSEYGVLGNGYIRWREVGTPSPIDYTHIGQRKVIQVSAKRIHSLFLCEDGTVFYCGSGFIRVLGDDDTRWHTVGIPSPIDITHIGDRKVVKVSAGGVQSLLLCEDGSVFSFGLGNYGVLGDGDTSHHSVGTPSPIDYTNIDDCKIVQVSAGYYHSLFLT